MTNLRDSHIDGLTVITTHTNADFDAMASMLAAQKLYPDALVVFPGSQEKNLRNFFVESMVYLFNMADIDEIDFSAVKRLVLVDTSQSHRIGKFASILKKSDIQIHIYDHHPTLANDVKGDYEVHQATGATVTILAEILKERNIEITSDEATVMCLGIYEDTGSFTFSSTTEKDFMAAAFLVGKGANLDIISNLISREINPEQVSILNDMFQAVTNYNIKGVDIVVTAITSEKYIPDFAFLVHKMVKMENINVIFALARMSNKVYVVARSRTSEVDVGAIVGFLGGGGHSYAASATIRNKTLAQTENELIEILQKNIHFGKRAKDLMSAPAIKIDYNVPCVEARDLLTRYNINALLVTKNNEGQEKLMGYITRQVVEKAIYLKLDTALVKEFMTTDIDTVGLNTQIPEIQKIILDDKQRILPVVEDGEIRGAITRSDLLHILVQESQYTLYNKPDPSRDAVNARIRNVVRFMKERLPNPIIDLLKSFGEVGSELGYGVFVVGGFVRDLFLYRKNEDIDIVVEGDGILFAKKFAAMHGARIHSYAKFGTAVIIFDNDFKIDVASARMEHYRFPADLPTVEMSSIKLDLFRRDFTINTLAIQLNPEKFGSLIDFFAAQKDIKEKSIRILHNLSFVEDPTRVYRAIRFEQRFGFTIGKLTSQLLKNVTKQDFFRKLSGRRVFTELRLILEEENPAPAIKRLDEYDLLAVIHPSLKPDTKMMSLFNAAKKVLSWHDLLFLEEVYNKWAVYFLILVEHCDRATTEEICKKLDIAPRHRGIFTKDRFEAIRTLYWLRNNLPVENSDLYEQLSNFRVEVLLYMMAATRHQNVKKALSHYFTQLRYVKTSITGKDLLKMGVKPGPIYRETLNAVLDAKLNNRLKTRNDELTFARNYVS